jgi:predicted outer membrane repeat protein
VEASPIFVGCWFINNAAAGDGGAIYVQDGDVRAEDCLFEGNRAQGGGAIRARRGTLTLVGCTLRGNTASGSGGAVQADAAVLDQCRLADNISNGRGGGVYASGLTALESAFTGNVTDYNGGAIYADHMRLTRCLISGNRARIVGGGIAATWLIADACDIRGNRSKEAGGAYVSSGPLLLLNSRFDDNTAEDGGGGGLLAHEMLWQTGHIRHCVFARNRAERKGDWGPAGGAMAFANNRRMDILNCTLVDNEALDGCAISAARQVGDPNYLTIRSCVIRGPQPLLWFYDLNLDFAYSNIEGGWPGVGNIDADPMFVDRTAGDYRLSPGSPCIDAADTPAVPHQDTADVSGAARFVDDPATPDSGVADPLRPMLDMGAFEFLSRDCNHNGLDDADDIAGGFSTDCNANGLPDECEVDCDGNGVADDCDLTAGRGEDCNGNRLPDDCDIALGLSQDINANGRPDECDVVSMPGDLNCDLFVDAKDIEPFVLALLDWQEYRRRYPDCSSSRGDINGDNRVNAFDIEGFIDLLAG